MRVKTAFQKGWDAYKSYAYSMDAVNPISEKGHNWYSHTLLMTPVDAFSTMHLMGLDSAKVEAKQLIKERLTFDLDMEVQQFEIAIRIVCGLVSAYQLDGDPKFLELATDLADRLMPVFDTPTGADMNTGERTATICGALDCFWGGCLILEGKTAEAESLQASIYKMWMMEGLEPESIDYKKMEIMSSYYMIRPEAIESTYYVWKAIGGDKYYEMGKTMFESIEKYCQVPNGYVQVRDVRTKKNGTL